MNSYEIAALAASVLAVAFIAVLLPKISRQVIGILALIYVAAVAGYFVLFYPCPWYKISKLNDQAEEYAAAGRWSLVEDIGKKLCDCGDQAAGWDWQGESEYQSGQYSTAINFWQRSAKARPEAQGDITAKIADAYVEQGDYKMAVDQFQILSAANPENMSYRIGYGRALIFYDRFGDAIDVLDGVPDTFGRGVARIFEAAAQYGYAASLGDEADRNKKLEQAKSTLCKGLAESPEWKELLEGNSDNGEFSKIRALILPYFKSDCTK